ncbi:MAG TPA: hypothetical protein VGM98_24485 [Schlesneria sp.]
MNIPILTPKTAIVSEILLTRRWQWWRSLWVRIPLMIALMWVIVGLVCWWPSRSAWAVFGVNGLAETSQSANWQRSVLPNFARRYLIQDRDVTSVLLFGTAVDDQWLVRLRRFPRLEQAALDGGQIGSGLQHLADLRDLKRISVSGTQRRVIRGWIDHVDSTISGRHFLLVPQLESLLLSGFKETVSDLDQLSQHPQLRVLSLNEISPLHEVLSQIENCRNIKSLSIYQKALLDPEAIASLCRMSHLETLTLYGENRGAVRILLDPQPDALETLTLRRSTKGVDVNAQLKQSLPKTSIVWLP